MEASSPFLISCDCGWSYTVAHECLAGAVIEAHALNVHGRFPDAIHDIIDFG